MGLSELIIRNCKQQRLHHHWQELFQVARSPFPARLTSGCPLHWHTAVDAAAGTQCTTVQEVDVAVKGYWVDQLWRLHAVVNAAESRAAFERPPPFFDHLPRCTFPHEPWALERVKIVPGHFRDGTGIPISVWKLLSDLFLQRVADLLGRVEAAENGQMSFLDDALLPWDSGLSRARWPNCCKTSSLFSVVEGSLCG